MPCPGNKTALTASIAQNAHYPTSRSAIEPFEPESLAGRLRAAIAELALVANHSLLEPPGSAREWSLVDLEGEKGFFAGLNWQARKRFLNAVERRLRTEPDNEALVLRPETTLAPSDGGGIRIYRLCEPCHGAALEIGRIEPPDEEAALIF